MVLWTINDFPARSSLSGWSGQGYKACPTCNEDTPSVRVLSKTAYVGHRRFLKKPHKWRRSLEFNGQTDNTDPPKEFGWDIAKPIIELCSLFKQICSATLMEDDMLKAQIKVVDILCELELIYPPALFDIMVHWRAYSPPVDIRQRHVDNDMDPEFSTTNEVIALDNGHHRDFQISLTLRSRRVLCMSCTAAMNVAQLKTAAICSPGPDGEMYFDSDVEDLIIVDDDMSSADVARSHGGDGGGDDRPPSHVVPTGCGGCFANKGKGRTWIPPARQRSTKASTCTCKKPTIPTSLLSRPKIGKADPTTGLTCGGIRRARPEEITAADVVISRQGSRSLARLRDEMRQASDTQEEERKRLEATGEYTNDEINALAIGGKLRGHIPGVVRVLPFAAPHKGKCGLPSTRVMFKKFESGGAIGVAVWLMTRRVAMMDATGER
ncbi:putative reverse transcriptase domain, ribonuclease H-like domain, aspartic peptidase domain protein [Tanacetum coccineum]|uniref:Reverse transcriptase domain, ribonuclease H-like domain, aspartic peptidase domain protein n=1 Tax=Tanacetum coccineum TaxID=301880 RepID=A0ABQ5E2C4_9ASTR